MSTHNAELRSTALASYIAGMTALLRPMKPGYPPTLLMSDWPKALALKSVYRANVGEDPPQLCVRNGKLEIDS